MTTSEQQRSIVVTSRRRFLGLLGIGAAGLSVAACGTDSGSEPTSGGAVGSGSQDAAIDRLVLGIPTDSTTLDPAAGTTVRGELSIISAIYSALTVVGPDGALAGDLATDWSQIDETTWEFILRDGVTFSDGTALDAEVIKWNVDRLLDESNNLANSGLFSIIAETTVVDPTTVRFTLTGPDANLPYELSILYFLSPEWTESHNVTVEALGSGPYLLTSYDPQTGATLEVNPTYYGTQPAVKTAELKFLTDNAARISAVQAGEVDIATVIDPSDLANVPADRYASGAVPSTRTNFLRFDTRIEPTNDVRVRQALNYAVDKQAIVDTVLAGLTEPSAGQVFSSAYGVLNETLSAYPYDPEKAKGLLAEAGYPDGISVTLKYRPGAYLADELVAQAIQQQVLASNITIELIPVTASELTEQNRDGTIGPLVYMGTAPQDGAWQTMFRYFREEHGTNNWANAEYSQLSEEIKETGDPDRLQEILEAGTQLVYDEVPILFLWPQPTTYAVDQDLDYTVRGDDWLRPQDVQSS